MKVECLLPIPDDRQWQAHLACLADQRPLPMFSSIVTDFLQEISGRILNDKAMRAYPELMAAAFWLRRSNLERLRQDFERRHPDKLQLPRGVVLHFAPSNVDSIFLYSWVLSMLAGNANIIRVSQRQNEQLAVLLGVIGNVLRQAPFRPIMERILIVSYPHDAGLSRYLSEYCNVRVIWGGDNTVRAIRAIPLPPLATEIVFADRFSAVALAADKVNAIEDSGFDRLLHHFYNDSFWSEQMACSSPRLVCWIGGELDIAQAKARFWSGLARKLQHERYHLPSALHMTRLTAALYYGASSAVKSVSAADFTIPLRVEIEELTDNMREMHSGGGLFLEMSFAAVTDVAPVITGKDQTLSYFGFSKQQLTELVHAVHGRGIDRVVPVGQALDFHEVWDGYHLLTYFSREVEIR